jgi:hypothetical protein
MALQLNIEDLVLYRAYQLILSWPVSEDLLSENEGSSMPEILPNENLVIEATSDEVA